MHPPSVDALARSISDIDLPQPLLVDAARLAIASGDPESARHQAELLYRSLLGPTINATGVLLHTNLGRAQFGYSQSPRATNLEFDLISGKRGSRSEHAGKLIAKLIGAESAIVVNNCAAAVTLVLAALATDKGVAVSRGELVEIGGGFRVPEIISQSGARLIEVGTTNRTRLQDYVSAKEIYDAALLLKVHPANYRITGFTEETSVQQLTTIDLPLVVDLGSGLLDEACSWLRDGKPAWLKEEQGAKQTIQAGADLVMFSCDKLLGGPQAGIIAGRSDLIAACSGHPLMRAFRAGGLILSALQETAIAYLHRDGDAIPFWKMAQAPLEELKNRANALEVGTVVATNAVAGGGALPGAKIPSFGVMLEGDHAATLRAQNPPIIARVNENTTIIDMRTISEEDDSLVSQALKICI